MRPPTHATVVSSNLVTCDHKAATRAWGFVHGVLLTMLQALLQHKAHTTSVPAHPEAARAVAHSGCPRTADAQDLLQLAHALCRPCHAESMMYVQR